jgi:hypothetical protein
VKKRDGWSLSRCEIESLCLVHAIGASGCSAVELPERLGLAPSLAPILSQCVVELIQAGWIEAIDGRFTVTDAGRAALADALTE